MMTLDGLDLFSSGPCELIAGSWQRELLRRGLPGVDGEVVLDLGARGRSLRQTGRLQAVGAAELGAMADAIACVQDGGVHTLVDHHGCTYANVLLREFELTTPVAAGRGIWVDYAIEYVQLP
jgi:hypothetical protein